MNSTNDWTRDFFTGLMLVGQRHIPYETKAEADFLIKVLEPKLGDTMLDVPCGQGRLTNELASRGYRCTGIDFTAPHLVDGRSAARERDLPATFEQGDMRQLMAVNQFDHAFCFGNSFAYFDDKGNAAFLTGVARALKAGGQFVLQTNLCAESVFTTRLKRAYFNLGELYFLVDTEYDPIEARLTSSYTAILDGKIEKKQAHYRIYTCRQLVDLMHDSGFTNVQTYGSLACEPYRLEMPGLILIGRRK